MSQYRFRRESPVLLQLFDLLFGVHAEAREPPNVSAEDRRAYEPYPRALGWGSSLHPFPASLERQSQ